MPENRLQIPLKDNLLVRWAYKGEDYLLHIRKDADADSPRIKRSYEDFMGIFDPMYAPGDYEWEDSTPKDFWNDYAMQVITADVKASIDEKLLDNAIMLAQSGKPEHLIRLTVNAAACIPIYRHDAPVISFAKMPMAQVTEDPIGWCWMHAEDAMALPGADDKNWKYEAVQYMQQSIQDYDDYLHGYNWWCQLRVIRDGEWSTYRGLSGFTGKELLSSRIPEEVRFGLPQVLKAGKYQLSTAKLITTWDYGFAPKGWSE